MKADAVFEGGGMRGIGIIGALSYFESCGYEWQRLAGTSCGALIAALIASGYSSRELKNLMIDTNFNKFLDKDRLQKIPLVGSAIGIFKNKAIYSGDYLEKWISELLKTKGISKFKDLVVDGECRIKIVAADVTKKTALILPDSLPDYGIDPLEFEVAKAIRMSSSIPFYFKPVKLTYQGGVSYIVDGSVACNFPIEIFDEKIAPAKPTIGFKFYNCSDNTSKDKSNALSFMFDIAGTLARGMNTEYFKPHNIDRTVFIPTYGVGVTDFKISKEKSLSLYRSGYRGALDFLNKWNFEAYKKNHWNSSVPMEA